MKSNKSNGQLTAQVNIQDHKKSGFDLSNNVLGTGKIGRIIPTRALHVMPGDTIKQDSKVVVQFEPLAVPILANMDVKQEHFYVPYNIVWKNWDKFISGGEKMDYKGVVPNVSMKDIVQVVFSILGFDFTINSVYNIGVRRFYIDTDVLYVNNPNPYDIRPNFIQAGETFNAKDLLKYHEEVIVQLNNLGASNVPIMFDISEGYGNAFSFINSDTENAIEAKAGATFNSKYLKTLLSILNDKNIKIIPSDEFVKYMSVFYELFKPLFGLGSNIDYLNMNRISLEDFIIIMYRAFVEMYLIRVEDEKDLETFEFGFGNSQYILSCIDDSPMSVLHLRANYNIWYNNYRDILLESDAIEPYDTDSVTQIEIFNLLLPRQRCWEKDAFTTALDNPCTGNVGVPITRNGDNNPQMSIAAYNNASSTTAGAVIANDMDLAEIEFDGSKWKLPTALLSGKDEIVSEDGESVNGFSLYALDAAKRAQSWLQKALLFGNRISDFYYLRFGVRYLDARLRLPELLSSSSELVKIDTIMNNTNIPSEGTIAGDRAGFASAYDNGNSFDRFCEEHGVIMSYLTIMPQVTYAYGMSRDYSRLDQFDFAFQEFATLGMDAVYASEITNSPLNIREVTYGDNFYPNNVFGYQGKYYDYKAKHSEEHGELLDTQDMYTFARKFNMLESSSRPNLNYEFVHCFPSLDMFVVDSQLADYFRYDIRHSTAAERGLPSQSIYV